MYVEKSLHFDELKYFANECEGRGANHLTYTNKWLKHLKSQQISRALNPTQIGGTNWGVCGKRIIFQLEKMLLECLKAR